MGSQLDTLRSSLPLLWPPPARRQVYAAGARMGVHTDTHCCACGWVGISPPGQVAARFAKGAILEGSTMVLWVLRPPPLWGLAPAP